MALSPIPSVTINFDQAGVRYYPGNRWPEDASWIEQCFTWTDRDSYLAWVAAWKAQLASIVAEIRQAKRERRDGTLTAEQRSKAQATRETCRTQCANLLLVRRLGKQRSARERQSRMAGV